MVAIENAIDTVCGADSILAGLMNGYRRIKGVRTNPVTAPPYLWFNSVDTDDDTGGKAVEVRQISMTVVVVDDLKQPSDRIDGIAQRVRALLHKQEAALTAALAGSGFRAVQILASGPVGDDGTTGEQRRYIGVRAHLEDA